MLAVQAIPGLCPAVIAQTAALSRSYDLSTTLLQADQAWKECQPYHEIGGAEILGRNAHGSACTALSNSTMLTTRGLRLVP